MTDPTPTDDDLRADFRRLMRRAILKVYADLRDEPGDNAEVVTLRGLAAIYGITPDELDPGQPPGG